MTPLPAQTYYMQYSPPPSTPPPLYSSILYYPRVTLIFCGIEPYPFTTTYYPLTQLQSSFFFLSLNPDAPPLPLPALPNTVLHSAPPPSFNQAYSLRYSLPCYLPTTLSSIPFHLPSIITTETTLAVLPLHLTPTTPPHRRTISVTSPVL